MYKNRSIAVVVPCFNEEKQLSRVIDTMPDIVDKIVVVDDSSTDNTRQVMEGYREKFPERIITICHEHNGGVGRAISSGYIWCRDNAMDIAVVMAGDAQMDPEDLPALLDPVVSGRADYTKGNRLITGEAWQKIPKVRYFGNACLTLMTKIASGYWHVTDSQSGYTAISLNALKLLPIEDIYPGYGMPNDFLVTLNIYRMRVMDIPINPLYNVGERSTMVIHRTAFSLFRLMIRLFFRRMICKYIIRDFHPLIFFYSTGVLLGVLTLPFTARLIYFWWETGMIRKINALTCGFLAVMSLQFLFFAMWFDMDYNRDLNPNR